MVTQSTRLFSFSYLIQLVMWPTLKVLKHVSHHLHSSQEFTNETGKTLCDLFDVVYGSSMFSSPLFALANIVTTIYQTLVQITGNVAHTCWQLVHHLHVAMAKLV